MLLWIIKDGEKAGPFEDYRIREMIREGQIIAETGIWHEGAEGWLPASEVQILKGEFTKADARRDAEAVSELEESLTPPPLALAQPPFLAWRRLGARVFDYFLYQLILVSFLRLGGFAMIPDPASQGSGWLIIGVLIPVILMEAALLSSLGFTPGKWLMSLRVENHLGGKLSTQFALIRSMRVWVLGMGMMHPILMLLGHSVTLWFGLKRGAPLWDLHSGFRVPGSELAASRVLLYYVLLVVVVAAIMQVMWPELGPMVEEEMARQRK